MEDFDKQKIVKLQRKYLKRIRSERKIFILMTVKNSFGKQLERIYYNTFIITDN